MIITIIFKKLLNLLYINIYSQKLASNFWDDHSIIWQQIKPLLFFDLDLYEPIFHVRSTYNQMDKVVL